jgi:hypothetical protein
MLTLPINAIYYDWLNQQFRVEYIDKLIEGFTLSQLYSLKKDMDNAERAAMEKAMRTRNEWIQVD